MTPRAVFDCMVFLQGAGRPAGPAAACLRLVDQGRITLCVSDAILAELRDVLARPETQRRFPGLTLEWITSFVANVEQKALRFTGIPRAFVLERDPKDEPYLNLAIAIGARYLVSRDRDLLDLMDDPDFRQRYPSVLIVEPPDFLEEMARQGRSEEAAGQEGA